MNPNYKFFTIGLITGGLVVWFIFNGRIISPDWQAMSKRNIDNNHAMMNQVNIDAHFIEQMIPHHDSAIEMANLALTKNTRPEIKKLSQDILKSQTAENIQMRTWYKEWFGRTLPEGDEIMMHHAMMSMHSDLSALEAAPDFDIAFITEMIPHHQGAVMMASMLKSGTTRPEMKQLADNIIISQSQEINLMRQWLKEWKQ